MLQVDIQAVNIVLLLNADYYLNYSEFLAAGWRL